jgi:hypothetical protein
MANKLVNDRMRLIRYGDENSDVNSKARKAAFNIAAAVCKAFFPNYPEGKAESIYLPNDYLIEPKRVFVLGRWSNGVSLMGKGNFGFPIYETSAEGTKPNGHMLGLAPMRCLAECIARGWLPLVVRKLECYRGSDAALRLAKELGLLFLPPGA